MLRALAQANEEVSQYSCNAANMPLLRRVVLMNRTQRFERVVWTPRLANCPTSMRASSRSRAKDGLSTG